MFIHRASREIVANLYGSCGGAIRSITLSLTQLARTAFHLEYMSFVLYQVFLYDLIEGFWPFLCI